MRVDVRNALYAAAADSERVNAEGIVVISKALADQMMADGESPPVVAKLLRIQEGVYHFVFTRVSA